MALRDKKHRKVKYETWPEATSISSLYRSYDLDSTTDNKEMTNAGGRQPLAATEIANAPNLAPYSYAFPHAGRNEGSNDQPLDSRRGASTRPAKRQRLPQSHQSATEPVARRTRAGRVAVASASTIQPDFHIPGETSTEWSEVPQLTVGTTSDEEAPEAPPQAPVRLPRSRQRFTTSVVESDGDLLELDERDASSGDEYQDVREGDDESQRSADEPERSADEQEGSADDAEAIDDEFQGPAGKSELEDVPEDDVKNVPLKANEEKRAEILRKVAAPHLKHIQAMVSLDRNCEMIYYTMDYNREGGPVKTNIDRYERRVVTFWSFMIQFEKAYRHVLFDRVCQEVYLTRRSEGLRRTGYLHETLKEHLHKDLTNMSVTLDVNRSDLGIVPDEISVFFGQALTWTTALGQKRQGSDHEATLIPEMSQIKGIECDPPPDYVLLWDSVTMFKLLGDSHFPQRYASELGCGLVGGLRGNSTYNERSWVHALSQKYPDAIFAMISDWDPYPFDNYLTLRRGAPAFVAENPHLATPRLIHIGPTYEDLNSNGAIVPLDTKDGPTRAENLLGHTHLPSELEPEVREMHEQVIRAQADKCRNPVEFAAARLLELRKSNTLWPESGNLGVLHIPVPNHDEDFELDLDAAVPADVVFGQDDESGMIILMANADNCRTILERCGEEFTISKYDADGDLTDQIVSTLKLAQQLLEAEREKTVAQRLEVGAEILTNYGATRDRTLEYFEGSRCVFSAAYPLTSGAGRTSFATGKCVEEWRVRYHTKEMKNKLASTRPRRRKAVPPADPVPSPSNVLQPTTKPVFAFKCARCRNEFADKAAYERHLKSSAECLQLAPHPASRPSTPLDEAGEEQAESTSSLDTVCQETFDSPEAKDSHLRTKEGWECVLNLANPSKMNRTKTLRVLYVPW
ncbi:Sterol 3-beta-glucosyltransferase [Rhizoctonia solani]|uniref:Sterol 3-beta-glucosyltransferase n=1 Tax=Rhizoctonia solani TaxID=456999 RepID=A0A0K6GFS8_9AGAM|nr:Sterol 3-beta-glucosyltransferase [Rhizoctonia solani]